MKRIGILGGTFNPPHNGHLLAAERVREMLELDEVWFIPTGVPPHKHPSAVSAKKRAFMVQCAIQTNDSFRLNEIEIHRAGPSYTIDTIRDLKKQYPGYQFYFIIGADMIAYLPRWHEIEELSKLIEFAGVNRSGYELESDYPVHLIEIPTVDISSTAIRERICKGKSVKYMTPDAVIQFIKEHQLYEN